MKIEFNYGSYTKHPSFIISFIPGIHIIYIKIDSDMQKTLNEKYYITFVIDWISWYIQIRFIKKYNFD